MAVSVTSDHFAAGARLDEALDASRALLGTLLEELGAGPDAILRERITRVLGIFPQPAAVFDAAGSVLTNARWRSTFDGVELPDELREAIELARVSTRVHLIPELKLAASTHTGYFSLAVRAVPTGSLVTCEDVTDQFLAKAAGVDPDAFVICATDPDGPTYYNEPWRIAVGTAWKRAVRDADTKLWRTAFDQARASGAAEVEVRLRLRDGGPRWHRLRFTRWRDERVIGTAVNIEVERARAAERKELVEAARSAREDAARATRLKDEFLAVVSHELRAPLTTLLLWQKVLREASDVSSQTRALDAIQHSASTQARLVADLLDVSRGISGKLYLDIRHVDVAQLLTEAWETARPLASAKQIELVLNVPGSSEGLHGDVTRLRQIIDNLLSNATKFTEPNGKITLSAIRRGRWVIIEVADTGRGITPTLLSKIFEPFTQLDETITRSEGGMGLGLTIARQLAELHRGTLTATSDGPGKGARFTLLLPSAGSSRAATPPVGSRQTTRLDGAHVLFVDDDARVRDALALLLQRTGAIVYTADSAMSGRRLISELSIDAVVCDIAMPGEDGYSFVHQLRKDGVRLPVIALTAYASMIDAQRALDAGFDVHLTKPISLERLVTSLSELLASRRLDETTERES